MNWLVILFVGVPVAFVAGVMLRKALEDIGEEYRDVREAAWAEVVKELERNSAAAKLSFEDGCVPKCNLGTREMDRNGLDGPNGRNGLERTKLGLGPVGKNRNRKRLRFQGRSGARKEEQLLIGGTR